MEINIIELEHLPIFTGKNSKALKSSKYKVSAFLLVYRMLIVAPKYGENEQKWLKTLFLAA